MNLRALSRIDLNLLVSLQVLFEERSVTRSAERLFITQPAMSRVLQRLRNTFEDPLFTRKGNDLVPTPLAKELQAMLPKVLGSIEAVMIRGEFDPASFSGELRVAAPEFLAVKLMPKLMSIVAKEAPNLSLAVTGEAVDVQNELADGEIDFAIDLERPFSGEIHTKVIGGFKPAIWMRGEHPLAANAALGLDEMLSYPFVQCYLLLSQGVSARVYSRFDRTLAEIGRARKKSFVTNQLMTAIDVVRNTDCLMLSIEDDELMRAHAASLICKPYPSALPYMNYLAVAIYQHERTKSSPVHNWFMGKVNAIIGVEEGGAMA